MDKVIQKLSSRKLWATIIGAAVGIAVMLGVDGNVIAEIAGAVLTVLPLMNYVRVEGKVDAEAVKNAIIAIQKATETIEGIDDNEVKN